MTMKSSAIRPIALVLSKELTITILLLLGVSFVVFIILFAWLNVFVNATLAVSGVQYFAVP